MSGANSVFIFKECVEEYTKAGTDARRGCEVFANGGALNRNIPAEKHELEGVVAGLRAIADGIQRDGMLNKRPA